MVVRKEHLKNGNLFVIDELERFVGEWSEEKFIDSMLETDPFEEDGYTWYYIKITNND